MSATGRATNDDRGGQPRLKLIYRDATERVKMRPRSAVTSGRRQFVNGDPNSAWARRFHDLVVGHVSDLGGRDLLSEAQYALCKRAAGTAGLRRRVFRPCADLRRPDTWC
jgi:hypothetical protein